MRDNDDDNDDDDDDQRLYRTEIIQAFSKQKLQEYSKFISSS
jgi:hypothetical protein